jgi:hypothetical protein
MIEPSVQIAGFPCIPTADQMELVFHHTFTPAVVILYTYPSMHKNTMFPSVDMADFAFTMWSVLVYRNLWDPAAVTQ